MPFLPFLMLLQCDCIHECCEAYPRYRHRGEQPFVFINLLKFHVDYVIKFCHQAGAENVPLHRPSLVKDATLVTCLSRIHSLHTSRAIGKCPKLEENVCQGVEVVNIVVVSSIVLSERFSQPGHYRAMIHVWTACDSLRLILVN